MQHAERQVFGKAKNQIQRKCAEWKGVYVFEEIQMILNRVRNPQAEPVVR